MSDKELPQFSTLEVDDDLAESGLNNPVLISALVSTFLTHPETVEDTTSLCDLTILNKSFEVP